MGFITRAAAIADIADSKQFATGGCGKKIETVFLPRQKLKPVGIFLWAHCTYCQERPKQLGSKLPRTIGSNYHELAVANFKTKIFVTGLPDIMPKQYLFLKNMTLTIIEES